MNAYVRSLKSWIQFIDLQILMLVKRMVSTGRRFANLGLQIWGLGMAFTGFRAFCYVEDVFAR